MTYYDAPSMDHQPVSQPSMTTIWERLLGGGGESDLQIDYSVLGVLVMTLGLIMIVEVFRHRLDHAAKGKPFFSSVLEGVYTECKSHPPP